MYLGIFDFVVIIVILILNILVWKYQVIKKHNWIFYLVIFLLFGFVTPSISMHFEIKNATKNLKNIDSFTLLYTFF